MNWHWFNWVIILLYFVGMFMVGVYFSKEQLLLKIILKLEEEFLLG